MNFVFIILLFSSLTQANVIQDDVSTTDKSRFSFKHVCSKMVTHESPLIDVISATEIDCMGKKISASDFCDKELAADPYYLRAWVDSETKEVVCHSGRKVLFKYLCVKLADKEICSPSAADSCKSIKTKLARRLDIVHSSFTHNQKGIKQLNCYFESL